MSIDEQKRIAFDQGRLAAWHGKSHVFPENLTSELYPFWIAGTAEQIKVMSDAAAKIPLLFADERAK